MSIDAVVYELNLIRQFLAIIAILLSFGIAVGVTATLWKLGRGE